MRILKIYRKLNRSAQIHFVLLCAWVALVVPTLAVWRESVPWLVFMSIYAIIVGHWSAIEAALAKRAIDEQAE